MQFDWIMDWSPHNLRACLDSAFLAYLTAGLAVGMLVWYLAIATRWYESLRFASPSGRSVWGWLIVIFVVCAGAGYVSLIISVFFPKTAVWWRIVFLAAQNIACPFFWIAAKRHKFLLQASYQSIGEKVASIGKDRFETMTDREIAETMRAMAAIYLTRQV